MFEIHENLKTPDDDVAIWRYTDFPKFISLLATSQLYFPRTDQMEDKWEGWYPMLSGIESDSRWTSEDAKKYRADLRKAQTEFRQKVFISCWHINNHSESVAMWKIYTLLGQGIAIRTTVGRFKQALKRTKFNVFIGGVEYGDYEDPQLNPSVNVLPCFCIKSREYRYEEEVRALVISGFKDAGRQMPEDRLGLPIDVDLKELVDQVILAPGSQSYLFAAVQSLLKQYGMGHITVRKSSLDHLPPILRDTSTPATAQVDVL